jgi:hypothetical protein
VKKGVSKVMQNLNIFCEERGVNDDAIFEYLWCFDLLGNNPMAVAMESMCQSISQKEMTNLN